MTATLSPQVRNFALVGIIAATALGAFFFLFARPSASDEPSPSAAPRTTETTSSTLRTTRAHQAKAAKPHVVARSRTGYPLKVDRALRHNGVVVVALYMPGATVDRAVVAEARAGATRSHTPYVAVSALNERAASQLVAKTGVVSQPAVLVVRRPGVVTASLGVTDRATVAQAVASARG